MDDMEKCERCPMGLVLKNVLDMGTPSQACQYWIRYGDKEPYSENRNYSIPYEDWGDCRLGFDDIEAIRKAIKGAGRLNYQCPSCRHNRGDAAGGCAVGSGGCSRVFEWTWEECSKYEPDEGWLDNE